MSKKIFKKGLIGLGIAAAVVGGIVGYFHYKGERDYLTWEEYLFTINAYNRKIKEIKQDCDNDTRCIKWEGKPRVIFPLIRSKKEIPERLNKWIENDETDPKYYKKRK